MSILALIQARTGSSRLPNKVLLPLMGKPVLTHIINRVQATKRITDIIVVTSIHQSDLSIVKLCVENDTRVFCGSEADVLDRFYQAAKLIQPDHIVRITGDCPVIDPEVIDQSIQRHLDTKADYTSNGIGETFPDGLDTEVMTFSAFETAWKHATKPSEREHVTQYFYNHKTEFKIAAYQHTPNIGHHRWTLDEPADYELIKNIYDHLYQKNPLFKLTDILTYLNDNPTISQLNAHIRRNEGLQKSLQHEIIQRREEYI